MFVNFKRSVWGRGIVTLFAFMLALQLAGCGDNEPKQRSAFIIFLQTEIIGKNRLNLPALTKEQAESFGEYANQYQLLVDFNSELKATLAPLADALATLRAMSSMKEMVDNRDKIQATLEQINAGNTKLNQLMESVERQKAALVQPEELKGPFDRAYDKVVVQQLQPAKEGFPLLAKLLTQALALIDFVNAKGDSARLTNDGVEFSSQADIDKFNELNANLQQAQKAYLAFSQRS